MSPTAYCGFVACDADIVTNLERDREAELVAVERDRCGDLSNRHNWHSRAEVDRSLRHGYEPPALHAEATGHASCIQNARCQAVVPVTDVQVFPGSAPALVSLTV